MRVRRALSFGHLLQHIARAPSRTRPCLPHLLLLWLAACSDYATAPSTGRLVISISGLPAGVQPAVTVTGPNSYSFVLGSSGTLASLRPGTYTITAPDVTAGSDRFTADPPAQTVVVSPGAEAHARAITYALAMPPLELTLQLVAEGLTGALFLAAPEGDPRLFVVQRPGVIRIIENGSVRTTPFLDIHERVSSTGELGMLSMAFDPQYATNGYFYVYYVDLNGDMVVERFGSTPGSNVAGASAGIVITIFHRGPEHQGGLTAFGPDGMLYIAPGDGRCCGDPANNAQNLNTLLGKMLRIDVRTLPYTVPLDNPFVGIAGARAEIWAYGLRNPWRYAFDAAAGLLYIADVGQDAREEVNVAATTARGLNYGWRLMEGFTCYNPSTNCNPAGLLTLPVVDYPHADGCSVIGGYVYRGAALPELAGHYLYADYCAGWLRSFRMVAGSAAEHRVWPGISAPFVVSFGRDSAGELYLLGTNRVWKIVRT